MLRGFLKTRSHSFNRLRKDFPDFNSGSLAEILQDLSNTFNLNWKPAGILSADCFLSIVGLP
ncbi:MAG: hypothetical protein CR988_00205 [Treponema sp.]|nr:MAG: hypothetical protein CR988_00205 [Treponema sp.]